MKLFRTIRNWVVRPARQRHGGITSYTGSNHRLAYTHEFKAWIKQTPNALHAFHFIRKNLANLKPNILLRDKKTGITIESAFTGEYEGSNALHLLRVTTGEREFFCKVEFNGSAINESDARRKTEAHRRARPIIKHLNEHGLNVALAPAHAIYETRLSSAPSSPKVTFVASDFYHNRDVDPLVGKLYRGNHIAPENYIKNPINDGLLERVQKIRNQMLDFGILDVHAHNMFHNPKTNQIILFDINS
jgi:hypothetical protein